MQAKLLRIMDANFNRAREGLRVCEDITRFVLDDKKASASLKKMRHDLLKDIQRIGVPYEKLLEARDSRNDIGKKKDEFEAKRESLANLFLANANRAKEALRSLEETAKLLKLKKTADFKTKRFHLYELEKRIHKKLAAILCD